MSTLYIRLPPHSLVDSVADLLALAFPFAQVSNAGVIEREGLQSLSNLSESIARIQQVVLLLSAVNVTLLRVQLPPLSSSKLKSALPNLVEEHLLCDSSECVIVAGNEFGGLRAIAVVQRAWLELLSKTLSALGARHIRAIPAQLCLNNQPGCVTASISEWDGDIDLTLRLSEVDGLGLLIRPSRSPAVEGKHELIDSKVSAAQEVIRSMCAVVPESSITLYVPPLAVQAYQEANSSGEPNGRINVSADNWSHWVFGATGATLNVMAGLNGKSGPKLDWRPWRWALVLAVMVVMINVAALNFDWWRMRSESSALRMTLTQIYKSTYPKDSVIIDPLAQMQQKISVARGDSGQAAPDDFNAITAAFGEAWSSANLAGNSAISALEYHERSLFVHLKPGKVEGKGAEALLEQIKAALNKRNLAVEVMPEQAGGMVWKIRSSK